MAKPPHKAKRVEVRAPMSGVFFRQPGPEDSPYVNVGDTVKKKQVLALLNQGISISQVSKMLDQEPNQIVAMHTTESPDVWPQYRERMLAAIRCFDEPALDSIYNDLSGHDEILVAL